MLLAIYVFCFFAFCLFVIIKSNIKTEEVKNVSSCEVEPDLINLENGLQHEVQNFLNEKNCPKRYSKKVYKHVRKSGGYKSRVSSGSVPMIQQED